METERKRTRTEKSSYTKNVFLVLSILLQLIHVLGRIGIGFVFRMYTAQELFTRLKNPLPLSEKSGVYSLRCKDCPATYIGQTGRKLSIRISEHKKALDNKTAEKSSFADHLLETGIPSIWKVVCGSCMLQNMVDVLSILKISGSIKGN